MLLLKPSIVIIFGIIAYQDFKQRAINWVLFPLLCLLIICDSLTLITIDELFNNTIFNLGFISVQLLILAFYLILRGNNIRKIIDHKIGIGDIVLFISLTLGFSRFNFIFSFILSLILSLLAWIIIRGLNTRQKEFIPLAGLMSLATLILFVIDYLSLGFSRYNDSLIIDLLYG